MPRERITDLSPKELEDVILLQPRIYCDYRNPARGPLEMLFIFAQTSDNAHSCFLRAIELAKAGMVKHLGISDGTLGHGYDGFDASVDQLKQLGWGEGFPFSIPIIKFDVGGGVNTRSEADSFVEWVKKNPGDIGVTATQFDHIVRAFATIVTVLNGHLTRVYSYPGITLPWNEEARHSQGTVKDLRANLSAGELYRLELYRVPEYKNLFTARQVIEYLNWRDGLPVLSGTVAEYVRKKEEERLLQKVTAPQ